MYNRARLVALVKQIGWFVAVVGGTLLLLLLPVWAYWLIFGPGD